jgi:DNA-directed RNA polymerase subunit RPC12/RpoP
VGRNKAIDWTRWDVHPEIPMVCRCGETFLTHMTVLRQEDTGKIEIYTRARCPHCWSHRGCIRGPADDPDFDIRNV